MTVYYLSLPNTVKYRRANLHTLCRLFCLYGDSKYSVIYFSIRGICLYCRGGGKQLYIIASVPCALQPLNITCGVTRSGTVDFTPDTRRRAAGMAMAKVCAVIGVGPGTGMACVKKWVAEGYKVGHNSGTCRPCFLSHFQLTSSDPPRWPW